MRRFHRRAAALAAASAALLVLSCGSEDPQSPTYPTDPASRYFEPDRILEVAIEMDAADYETLRFQTRNWWDVVAAPAGQCLIEPNTSPFTNFEANVTVDGVRLERVAIRKKGFLGSIITDKPSFRIKFDTYVPGQTLAGQRRLVLNGANQDPSYVKQCLAYKIFGDAGIPVPRCHFARVSMNGRDLGLYVHVEAVDKVFLRRTFEDESGDLWEGELSDFRVNWVTSFELKTNEPEDNNQREADRARLDSVARILQRTDADLLEGLEPLVDVEQFLTFWAIEVILEHWDGYANSGNNFFLYDDPKTGRFVFMPWGTDQILMPDPFTEDLPPPSVYARGILSWRFYKYAPLRDRYLARLRELLDSVFKEEDLIREIDRMEALFRPLLAEREGELDVALEAIDEVRRYVRSRRGVLIADLDKGPYAWDRQPRESPCVEKAGEVRGTFQTTWGTNGRDAFASGSGTLSVTFRGQPLQFRRVGATAGPDQNDPNNTWPVVNMNAQGADGLWYNLWLVVRPDLFKDGASGTLEWTDASGGMGVWDPFRWEWRFMGSFVTGPFALERAAAVDGAPVNGSFETWLILWE